LAQVQIARSDPATRPRSTVGNHQREVNFEILGGANVQWHLLM
jgi:hypothetical protein